MSTSLFEVRPVIEEHERKISEVERDIALLHHAQTDLKIDLVDAGEKNRTLIINAIEINRKLLTGISQDIYRDIQRINKSIDIKIAALAFTTIIGFSTVIYLLVG
jgi:hypothetical protein